MQNKNAHLLYAIIPLLFLIVAAFILSENKGKNTTINQFMLDRAGLEKGPGSLPSDWMSRQRAYPYGRIKSDVWLEAIRGAQQINRQASSYNYTWEAAGPFNIGGRITDIEMPEGSFSTIYAATASGGIFKTENSGNTWVNIFSDAATISIGDIAIGKSNTNLIYAGTGESNASSQSFRGDGVYKSTDGGNSWANVGLEQSAYIGRLVIDYSNEERVFVAACGNLFSPDENRGVYRTTDGGDTWQQVLFLTDSTSAIDIVQHPTDPNILYAAMWERMRGLNYRRSFGESSGIWKTTDGGDTWTELTTGLPTDDQVGRIGLAISPSQPDVMYAFYDNQNQVKVFRSPNGGTNWSGTSDFALQGMNSNFGWYFGQVRVHPDFPDIFYLMGVDLYFSADGGNSYTQLAGYFNSDEIHVDHHAMYIHPVTGRIYEGNDGGLYYSDDMGFSWTWLNNIPVTQFYDIEIDYLNPSRLYGGTQDNNSIRTYTGQTDDWEAILGGDGFYSLVDYTRSNVIYAEYQWGKLHKSTNSGNSMSYIAGYWENDRVNWSAPVIMHPQNPNTLYFGTYRVWKSTNAGNSWVAVSGDLTAGDDGSTYHTISTLAISPVDPDIVLAGTDDGRVHVSTNGGLLWNEISTGLPDRWITRVAADPFDVNTIYVTCSGFRWDEPLAHVYRSLDRGLTWQPIGGNLPGLPVNAFVADPTRESRLFVGTDAGVFVTIDQGETWESLNQGLGNVPVMTMKIHDTEEMLVIGTYGLSAYRLDLNELAVDVKPIDLAAQRGLSLSKIYPQPLNPGSSPLYFNVVSDFNGKARASILDIMGRPVAEITGLNLAKGVNTFSWDGRGFNGKPLSSGNYILVVESNGKKATGKILLSR